MSSLNKVILIGYLGRAPESRVMPNGDMATSLVLATSDKWKDKSSGEQKEHTEWHRISVFRKLAEICAQFLDKGSLIYLEGKIKTRKYTDKDGIERYATEIIADTMQMLGSRQTEPSEPSAAAAAVPAATRPAAAPHKPARAAYTSFDDDIPFAPPARKTLLAI